MTDGVKRSVTIAKHRTSVSLEQEFWNGMGDVARARGLSLNKLIAENDADRDPEQGLSSALRVFVLEWFQNKSAD